MIDKLFLVFQLWHAFICILQNYICLNMCYIEEVFLALHNLVGILICAKMGLNDFFLPKEDGKSCRKCSKIFFFLSELTCIWQWIYIFHFMSFGLFCIQFVYKKFSIFLYVTKTCVFRLICILTFEFHYFLCLF